VYSVVIVDDEPLVLYGVSTLLNSGNGAYRISRTFRDGASALEYCLASPPDLLLTDIKMPGMDGLALIEGIRPCFPDMKIVVLSCHEEFDLVRKAFRLGADEYLLKHSLENVSFFETLSALLPSRQAPAGIPSGENGEPGDFPAGPGTLGIIGFKQEYGKDLECIPWAPDRNLLIQIIRAALTEGSGQICFTDPGEEILLFLPEEGGTPADRSAGVNRIMESLRRLLSGYVNRKVFIALEEIGSDGIEGAYKRVLETIEMKFYFNHSSLLHTGALPDPDGTGSLPDFSPGGRNRLPVWKQELTAYLNRMETRQASPSRIRSDLSCALYNLFCSLEKQTAPESEGTLLPPLKADRLYEEIRRIDDKEILRQWTERKLESIQRILNTIREKQTVSGAVREYVINHYSAPISLPETAALFNVTPSYLSTCFKQDTGISFIGFVNRTRISRACRLLETTDLTVKEICYKTGYENPNYFSRLFKKMTGKTVSEYRERIIDGKPEGSSEK